MTTSTPPAWHWLEDLYVPVETPETPDSATLGKRNGGGVEPGASSSTTRKLDPDPTGEDIWPLERAVSTTETSPVCADQCPDCRCAPDMPHSPDCDCTAQLTDAHSNAAPEHPERAVSQAGNAPDTGNPFPGLLYDLMDKAVASRPECGSVTDIDYGQEYGQETDDAEEKSLHDPAKTADKTADTIPLWKQALWLARHIEDLHSPRPDVLGDDELRGLTLIRVLGIGADEHGDEVFRKGSPELREDRAEEWSDGEFYDLVDRFGDELD